MVDTADDSQLVVAVDNEVFANVITAVLTPDLIALFFSAFLRATKTLFLADLMLAKVTPPKIFNTSYYSAGDFSLMH